jgi:outer membrane receptor protein involved in Fe transport
MSSRFVRRTAPGSAGRFAGLGALILLCWTPFAGFAQQPADSVLSDTLVYEIDPVVVTATRTARPVSQIPQPVSLINRARIQEKVANTVSDLFRDLPGVDVNGVGANQARPIIRGQRGQRILLLQDGIRLNNSRRQQDFGELPALVDVAGVERVEVVRGPSSVLYGTDAIGGVLNIVTPSRVADGIHGSLGYRFGTAGDQKKYTARFSGGFGRFDLIGGATYRDANPFSAPEGSFGNITLANDVRVQDSGVQDESFDLRLGYRFSDDHRVFVKGERYAADEAGFGWVDPEEFNPGGARTQILYPRQRFNKLTFGYGGQELGTALADRLDFTGYVQSNERTFGFDLFTSFGPMGPPGAGIAIETVNYTDLDTYGFRLEAKKLAAQGVLLTYGVDLFRDDAVNADTATTTLLGFGPPQEETSTSPTLPDATYRSIGAFLQGELELGGRATLILGGRVQDIKAESRSTSGLEDLEPDTKDDRSVVGAANLVFDVTDDLSLITSVGRAFRAPNLIEWLFEGPTPEGNGFQVRNPDLRAETSVNYDVGARFVNDRVFLEGFYFRNTVNDGIRIEKVEGLTVGELDAYRNVNVDELLFQGVELAGDVFLPQGFSVGGNHTWMDTENKSSSNRPIGESFSSKVTGRLRYREPGGRFWAEYAVRRNGDRKDDFLLQEPGEEPPPVGEILPGFTTMDLRGGVTLFRTRNGQTARLTAAVTNLTNELYAEFSNASFFRPEPRRALTVSLDWSF